MSSAVADYVMTTREGDLSVQECRRNAGTEQNRTWLSADVWRCDLKGLARTQESRRKTYTVMSGWNDLWGERVEMLCHVITSGPWGLEKCR